MADKRRRARPPSIMDEQEADGFAKVLLSYADGLSGKAFRKFKRQNPLSTACLEDFYSAALEGIAYAANTYDPDSGVKPITYALPSILNALKREANKSLSIGFPVPRKHDNGHPEILTMDSMDYADIEESEEPPDSLRYDLAEAIGKLDEFSQKIIKMHYMECKSDPTIAEILGIGVGKVCRTRRKALKKLRWKLEDS